LIHGLLTGIRPFAYTGLIGTLPRGKVDLETLEETRKGVAGLAQKAGIDFEYQPSGYPHFPVRPEPSAADAPPSALQIIGWRALQFVQQVATANVAELAPGASVSAFLLDCRGTLIDRVLIQREERDEWGRDRYLLSPSPERVTRVATWLRHWSDGYVLFDEEDILRKIEGPVIVEEVQDHMDDLCLPSESVELCATASQLLSDYPDLFDLTKPYFIGQSYLLSVASDAHAPSWHWEPQDMPLMRTPLFEAHRAMGATIVPFAGWEMPVWYSSVSDEHQAVRETAGLFDVAHMGVFEVEGPHAIAFLDTVCTNYVAWLEDGQSCYSYLLDPQGAVIDDVMVYRLQSECFLLVVNAANEVKDWDWLNAVNERRVLIDLDRPWVRVEAPAVLRNLKDPAEGERQKRDLALQGPASLPTLQAMTDDLALREALARIRRTDLVECELAGFPLVLAHTGYTGEKWGFEIFVHPDNALALWRAILEAGAPFGVRPAGLGARDSTRTEAGLPLYGHELAGHFAILPDEAGFSGYVKYHKPFFIGRQALLAQEGQGRLVVRFRVDDRGVRVPHLGDPVANRKGQFIGHVTSCSIDAEGQ
ncbi:MAG: glycine cleavage system aminomethyltransferase GcvT, partial [Anaerolineae bacterium]|nr:glycine cleavage system aminomethyltransferase GcvT [Anaerolineae bacterium]